MLPLSQHKNLLSWALWQHGDHIHQGCPIAEALTALMLGDITFEHLVVIIRETDDGFEESFREYLEELKEQRQMDLN